MVSNSKSSGKRARAGQRRAVAQALREAAFWTESVVAEWMALRTSMFSWLEAHDIPYQGTRDAIVSTMRHLGPIEATNEIIFLYHVATLAEWDEDFTISEEQATLIKQIGERAGRTMLARAPGANNEA